MVLEYENSVFEDYRIDIKALQKIIKEIPNGKSRGFTEIQPEMYKYALNSELLNTVSLIIETMIKYGITPYLFNIGIIKPIIKDDKRDNGDINNLRPVTVSDTLANIYEKIILTEIDKTHTNKDRQFGFKVNSSCGHAGLIVSETIKLNNKKNKKTLICAIDASKAFDKVNRKYLWLKLKSKVKPCILKSLISYYSDSMAIVQNDGENSNIFETSIGVKQGGPLSPRLFSMYVEDLIDEIDNNGLGVKIENIEINIIMYADDILLVSSSYKNLQKLLKITEEYGKKWEIKFNPEKTLFMEFGNNHKNLKEKTVLKFDQKEIKKVDKMKYLGINYNRKLNNKDHMNKKRGETFNVINKMRDIGIESDILTSEMKIFLYKTYCRPTLYYGMDQLVLTNQDLKDLQTTEANIVKRIFGLSQRVKTTELIYGIGLEKSTKKIEKMKIKFFERICKNEYTRNYLETLARYFRDNQKKINKNSILFEIKNILGSDQYLIERLLAKGPKKIRQINKETKLKKKEENVKKIEIILKKDGCIRTEELKAALNAF